jgi:hypothetical protein
MIFGSTIGASVWPGHFRLWFTLAIFGGYFEGLRFIDTAPTNMDIFPSVNMGCIAVMMFIGPRIPNIQFQETEFILAWLTYYAVMMAIYGLYRLLSWKTNRNLSPTTLRR